MERNLTQTKIHLKHTKHLMFYADFEKYLKTYSNISFLSLYRGMISNHTMCSYIHICLDSHSFCFCAMLCWVYDKCTSEIFFRVQ